MASKSVDFPAALDACSTFKPSVNGPTETGFAKHRHP